MPFHIDSKLYLRTQETYDGTEDSAFPAAIVSETDVRSYRFKHTLQINYKRLHSDAKAMQVTHALGSGQEEMART